jgi:microcystin-dependent protein
LYLIVFVGFWPQLAIHKPLAAIFFKQVLLNTVAESGFSCSTSACWKLTFSNLNPYQNRLLNEGNAMNIFLGSIMTFGFQFNPSGWQQCNGQTLGIDQYSALFALLGTNFGGDGVQTFQLPNLQGRMPLCQGNGATLSPRVIGEFSGTESISIGISNLPSHTHTATFTPAGSSGYTVSGNTTGNLLAPTATNNIPSGSPAGTSAGAIWGSTAPTIPLGGAGGGSGATVSNALTGNSQAVGSMNPYLALNFSIALAGIFPSRN